MASPAIKNLSDFSGPTSGGELVRISGHHFSAEVEVLFGEIAGEVLHVVNNGAVCFADVHTPAHNPGTVDVILKNLDEMGQIIPDEVTVSTQAYTFQRPDLVKEADLTRLVRALLKEIKRQVIHNTNITVSVDYDNPSTDDIHVVAMSSLPALVLSGPRLSENRFYSSNVLQESVIETPFGAEIVRCQPPLTVDLDFALTVASESTVELLNLMAAIATFFGRNPWFSLLRDPSAPAKEFARFEMALAGDFLTSLDAPDGVRAFTCGFVIRGFDIDEGQPLDLAKRVEEADVDSRAKD